MQPFVTFDPSTASRKELLAEIERLRGLVAATAIATAPAEAGRGGGPFTEIGRIRAEAASYLRAAWRARQEPAPDSGDDDLLSRLRRSEAARVVTEERLALAFEASGSLGWWDWDLNADKVYAGPYFAEMFGVEIAEAEAGVAIGLFVEGIHPDDRDRIGRAIDKAVRGGGDFDEDYRLLNRRTGKVLYVHARGRCYLDAKGRPLRFPGVAIDVTSFRESEQRKTALVGLGDRLRELQDVGEIAFAAAETMATQLGATRAGFGIVEPKSETVEIQPDWRLPGVRSITGSHHFRSYGSFIDDLKRGEIVVIEDVTTDPRTASQADQLDSIGIRVLLNVPILEHGVLSTVVFVHFDRPHRFSEAELRFVRTVADRTHAAIGRSHAEERERLLNRELSHRLKNTLAMVQAIVAQTLRNAPDLLSARESLSNRLMTLSRAHELLLGRSLEAADIRSVAQDALALHDDGQNRIRVSGPSIDVGSSAALSLALILHELATNAVKYGSLSVPDGFVSLGWDVDRETGGDRFHLVWREEGGPPVVEPARRGFGSRLIERGIAGSIGGHVEQNFRPEGLLCRIELPLAALQAPAG